VACAAATVVGVGLAARDGIARARHATVPLAPFLALGAMIYVLWGQNIIDWYFGLLG